MDGLAAVPFRNGVAIIPWTYMSDSMNAASQSLVAGKAVLGKIYFPRILYPLTPILAKLVDFAISLVIVAAVMLYYDVAPTWNLLMLPVLFIGMVLVPTGLGMWLAALAIRYRDIKFAMTYVIKLLIYSAPIMYSAAAMSPRRAVLVLTEPDRVRHRRIPQRLAWERRSNGRYIIPGLDHLRCSCSSRAHFISGAWNASSWM